MAGQEFVNIRAMWLDLLTCIENSILTKDDPVENGSVSMVQREGVNVHQYPETHLVRYHVVSTWDGFVIL